MSYFAPIRAFKSYSLEQHWRRYGRGKTGAETRFRYRSQQYLEHLVSSTVHPLSECSIVIARLIVMRAQSRRWPRKGGNSLAVSIRLRVARQLSISAPPGACSCHLILKRGDLWRTAKNRRKFEPRRNRRQNTSRKAAPIRTARARFCKCPSGPISGMKPAAKILLRFPIQLAATLILLSPTNFKAAQ